MKKLFVLLLLLVTTFALVSCDDVDLELEAPTNVSIAEGILTWNAVDDADGYLVVVGTDDYDVSPTTFDLNALDLTPGSYNVTVSSKSGDSVSVPSAVLIFVVEEDTPDELDAPTGLSIDGNVLSWNAVAGAARYQVAVGEELYETTEATFDLAPLFLAPGTYDVAVTAISGERASDGSVVLSHVVEASLDQEVVLSTILQTMNPLYAPDMDEQDFEYEDEYDQYVQMTVMVETYVTAAMNSQMTEENAIGLFNAFYSMPEKMAATDNLTALMEEMDGLEDFDLTTENLVYMLMEFLMMALEMGEAELTEVLAELGDSMDVTAIIANAFEDPDFLAVYNSFNQHLPVYYQDLYDSMFTDSWEHDALWALYNVGTMANDIFYDFDGHDPYYLEWGSDHLIMYYDTLVNAHLAGDTDFLQALADNSYDVLDPFFDLFYQLEEARYAEQEIEQIEMQLDLISTLRTTILEDPDMFSESLEGVLDYLLSVYDSVTPLLVLTADNAFEQGFLTLEEGLIIKDEVVFILQETLPDAEDFAHLYTMFGYLGEALTDTDMTEYIAQASVLGQYNHESLDLMLSILGDVDQTTVEDILAITDGLYTPEFEIDNPETGSYEYYPEVIDYAKVVELLVYVGHYVQDIETTYATEIASIEALMDSNFTQDTAFDALLMLLDELEGQMPPEQYDMVVALVEAMIADMDNIQAGLEIFETIGDELIDEFLTSEGAFFLQLIELIEEGPVDPAADVYQLLLSFVNYNDALLIGADQETIEAFLNALRAPLSVAVGQMFGPGEFELLFDELVPAIAEVIQNIATFEQALLDAAIALDAPNLYFASTWGFPPDMLAMVVAVLVIDEAITLPNSVMLYDTIDILFEDILGNETIMMMFDFDQMSLDAMHTQVVDTALMILGDIQTIATFDFDNLTWEQEEALFDFMFMIEELLYGQPEEPVVY